MLILTGFAAFDLLKSPPISTELKLVLLGHTGSASGQAYFEIESNCPTNSTTTETQSLPLVSPAIWIVCQLKFSLYWSILQQHPRTDPLVCNNI